MLQLFQFFWSHYFISSLTWHPVHIPGGSLLCDFSSRWDGARCEKAYLVLLSHCHPPVTRFCVLQGSLTSQMMEDPLAQSLDFLYAFALPIPRLGVSWHFFFFCKGSDSAIASQMSYFFYFFPNSSTVKKSTSASHHCHSKVQYPHCGSWGSM